MTTTLEKPTVCECKQDLIFCGHRENSYSHDEIVAYAQKSCDKVREWQVEPIEEAYEETDEEGELCDEENAGDGKDVEERIEELNEEHEEENVEDKTEDHIILHRTCKVGSQADKQPQLGTGMQALNKVDDRVKVSGPYVLSEIFVVSIGRDEHQNHNDQKRAQKRLRGSKSDNNTNALADSARVTYDEYDAANKESYSKTVATITVSNEIVSLSVSDEPSFSLSSSRPPSLAISNSSTSNISGGGGPPVRLKISWKSVVEKFTQKYNDVYMGSYISRKAHLDRCGPKSRVIDGAKEKWCPIALLDAVAHSLILFSPIPLNQPAGNSQPSSHRRGTKYPRPAGQELPQDDKKVTKSHRQEEAAGGAHPQTHNEDTNPKKKAKGKREQTLSVDAPAYEQQPSQVNKRRQYITSGFGNVSRRCFDQHSALRESCCEVWEEMLAKMQMMTSKSKDTDEQLACLVNGDCIQQGAYSANRFNGENQDDVVREIDGQFFITLSSDNTTNDGRWAVGSDPAAPLVSRGRGRPRRNALAKADAARQSNDSGDVEAIAILTDLDYVWCSYANLRNYLIIAGMPAKSGFRFASAVNTVLDVLERSPKTPLTLPALLSVVVGQYLVVRPMLRTSNVANSLLATAAVRRMPPLDSVVMVGYYRKILVGTELDSERTSAKIVESRRESEELSYNEASDDIMYSLNNNQRTSLRPLQSTYPLPVAIGNGIQVPNAAVSFSMDYETNRDVARKRRAVDAFETTTKPSSSKLLFINNDSNSGEHGQYNDEVSFTSGHSLSPKKKKRVKNGNRRCSTDITPPDLLPHPDLLQSQDLMSGTSSCTSSSSVDAVSRRDRISSKEKLSFQPTKGSRSKLIENVTNYTLPEPTLLPSNTPSRIHVVERHHRSATSSMPPVSSYRVGHTRITRYTEDVVQTTEGQTALMKSNTHYSNTLTGAYDEDSPMNAQGHRHYGRSQQGGVAETILKGLRREPYQPPSAVRNHYRIYQNNPNCPIVAAPKIGDVHDNTSSSSSFAVLPHQQPPLAHSLVHTHVAAGKQQSAHPVQSTTSIASPPVPATIFEPLPGTAPRHERFIFSPSLGAILGENTADEPPFNETLHSADRDQTQQESCHNFNVDNNSYMVRGNSNCVHAATNQNRFGLQRGDAAQRDQQAAVNSAEANINESTTVVNDDSSFSFSQGSCSYLVYDDEKQANDEAPPAYRNYPPQSIQTMPPNKENLQILASAALAASGSTSTSSSSMIPLNNVLHFYEVPNGEEYHDRGNFSAKFGGAALSDIDIHAADSSSPTNDKSLLSPESTDRGASSNQSSFLSNCCFASWDHVMAEMDGEDAYHRMNSHSFEAAAHAAGGGVDDTTSVAHHQQHSVTHQYSHQVGNIAYSTNETRRLDTVEASMIEGPLSSSAKVVNQPSSSLSVRSEGLDHYLNYSSSHSSTSHCYAPLFRSDQPRQQEQGDGSTHNSSLKGSYPYHASSLLTADTNIAIEAHRGPAVNQSHHNLSASTSSDSTMQQTLMDIHCHCPPSSQCPTTDSCDILMENNLVIPESSLTPSSVYAASLLSAQSRDMMSDIPLYSSSLHRTSAQMPQAEIHNDGGVSNSRPCNNGFHGNNQTLEQHDEPGFHRRKSTINEPESRMRQRVAFDDDITTMLLMSDPHDASSLRSSATAANGMMAPQEYSPHATLREASATAVKNAMVQPDNHFHQPRLRPAERVFRRMYADTAPQPVQQSMPPPHPHQHPRLSRQVNTIQDNAHSDRTPSLPPRDQTTASTFSERRADNASVRRSQDMVISDLIYRGVLVRDSSSAIHPPTSESGKQSDSKVTKDTSFEAEGPPVSYVCKLRHDIEIGSWCSEGAVVGVYEDGIGAPFADALLLAIVTQRAFRSPFARHDEVGIDLRERYNEAGLSHTEDVEHFVVIRPFPNLKSSSRNRK